MEVSMAVIRPFECVRPDEKVADRVAALPYDVYDSKEARVEVEREPLSFLKIDRAETQFDESVDMYSEQVYKKAHDMLMEAIDDGTFITDKDKAYYVYEQSGIYENVLSADEASSTASPYILASANAFLAHCPVRI
jgi:uncharacterized protein (DUF1015 family)